MLAALLKKANIQHILLLAILLRVIWAVLVPVVPVSDSFLYNAFAQSIASKHQYAFPDGSITVYWPVGTSAIYAIFYSLFGQSFLPILLFNILLGAGMVWLTYALTLRYINAPLAVLAAAIVACWPILIQFTTILASELIFTFFVLLAVYIWGCERMAPRWRTVLWAAAVCIATYTRPTALLLIAILPFADWVKTKNIRANIGTLIIASLSAALIFAPWVYRNYQQFGHPVLVSANGGVNLWMGNHPNSNGGYMDLPNIQFKNEVERDIYFKKEAIAFIKHNPVEYVKLAVKRTILTYKAETIGIVWNGALDKLSNTSKLALKLISSAYWWLILSLSFYGFYRLLKDQKIGLFHPLSLVAGYFFMFPILTVGQDRYHLPVNPFLAIFSAYAITVIRYNLTVKNRTSKLKYWSQ